jgi:3-oxoacyl-[acyl-carrier protein] reductase
VSNRLSDRVALVTGAGGLGLGRAGARLFARHGARVVVVDNRPDGVSETVRQIREEGGDALGVEADVRSDAEVEEAVASALERFGRIDILWNNAAILTTTYARAEDISIGAWQETFDVNIAGYFRFAKNVIPQMKAQHAGVIVNTASWGALTGLAPGYLDYAASKAAVVQFTRTLAVELGPFNIRVNCLAGGGIRGPGGVQGDTPPVRPSASPFEPLPLEIPSVMPSTDATRWPTPDEVAHAALYLADAMSGPVTGIVLTVDGGRTSRTFP